MSQNVMMSYKPSPQPLSLRERGLRRLVLPYFSLRDDRVQSGGRGWGEGLHER
jgi:hypothetical protein